MGEEKIGPLNTPVKGGIPQESIATSVGETPALPLPIPTTIPKPKLPIPFSSSKSAETSSTMTTKDAATAAKKDWNTSKLGLRVGVDALSAGAAGALVAPIITMIDKGIIENASGRNTLGDSLRQSARELLLRPHRFIASKPFALIFSLYFGTYFTANTIDTASSTIHSTPPSSTTAGTPKFLATSSANLALCLYKDNAFTRLFGSATSSRPVPLPTFALFTVRDCLTIFASFNLPPLLAPRFEEKMSEGVRSYVSSASVAQFVTPAAVQLVSTPLHLLGLDLYNRPGVAMLGGEQGRVARVLRDWAKSAAARICRIVPAFGVGGVVNMKVRKGMMGRLE
ncbi:hypothetical protein BKA63DRAFT_482879 [Paraphoma chrysanthemicola]|nr:hypothetical protein BKA63DRAFT_482879 [Paraphoma chrysanthemicola]